MIMIGTVLMVVCFLILIFSGFPIFISMGLPASVLSLFVEPPGVIGHVLINSINKYPLCAIPFFILMSNLILQSKDMGFMFDFAKLIVGRIRGGLGVSTIVISAIMAAISGSSAANAAAIGLLTTEEMTKAGYPRSMAAGLAAIGGVLGILIPPSINMILYGAITDTSVVQLFKAGLVPGIILSILLSVETIYLCKKRNVPLMKDDKGKSFFPTFIKALPVLVLPIVVLGSIYGGIATPTESAVIGTAYALILGIVRRRLNLRKILLAIEDCLKFSGMILAIIAAASLFSYILTISGFIPLLIQKMTVFFQNQWSFVLAVNVFLLILGQFLDVSAIMYLTVPIFYPIASALGINPIQFGIMYVLNMEIGLITPPVGLNSYIISGITGIPLMEVVRGALPFLILFLLMIFLVMSIPMLTLGI